MVELACGKGELLARLLAARPGARARGVDRSPWYLADARARAEELGVADRLELLELDATEVEWRAAPTGPAGPSGRWDLAVSMGAAGIVGDHAATVALLAAMVGEHGGLVLFGDGVWLAEPPDPGLAEFGMERDELPIGLDGQRAFGAAVGLEPLWSELVSVGEWDDYEGAYAGSVVSWAAAHPDDPERDDFLERAALMRRTYAGWRRDAFGFGISLFGR